MVPSRSARTASAAVGGLATSRLDERDVAGREDRHRRGPSARAPRRSGLAYTVSDGASWPVTVPVTPHGSLPAPNLHRTGRTPRSRPRAGETTGSPMRVAALHPDDPLGPDHLAPRTGHRDASTTRREGRGCRGCSGTRRRPTRARRAGPLARARSPRADRCHCMISAAAGRAAADAGRRASGRRGRLPSPPSEAASARRCGGSLRVRLMRDMVLLSQCADWWSRYMMTDPEEPPSRFPPPGSRPLHDRARQRPLCPNRDESSRAVSRHSPLASHGGVSRCRKVWCHCSMTAPPGSARVRLARRRGRCGIPGCRPVGLRAPPRAEPVVVGRQGIFSTRRRPFGYQLSFRSGDRACDVVDLGPAPARARHRATSWAPRSDAPTSTTSPTDAALRPVPARPTWSASSPLPHRPDRLVVEIADTSSSTASSSPASADCATAGFRIALPGFYGRADAAAAAAARRLREDRRPRPRRRGRPVVDLARSTARCSSRSSSRPRRCSSQAPRSGSTSSRATSSSAPACSTAPAHGS